MGDIRTDTALAVRMVDAADAAGFPRELAWETAPGVCFSADWQGKNVDEQRETRVRLLWNAEFLFLRFDARYRSMSVFADAEPSGRRDGLWDRDVCEVFLQPPCSTAGCYKEIEVAPNGLWIDLEIAPGKKRDLRSALRRRVNIDEAQRQWHAVLALPMRSLVAPFEIPTVWRVNFFRVEGAAEPRFYSAWRPTKTRCRIFTYRKRLGRWCSQRQQAKSGASEESAFFLCLRRGARAATPLDRALKPAHPRGRFACRADFAGHKLS